MITSQKDMFGENHRVEPWDIILKEAIRRYLHMWGKMHMTAKTSEELWNKRVIGDVLSSLPETHSLASNIRKAPTNDIALRLLRKFFEEKMPSTETLARGLRLAKVEMGFDRNPVYQDGQDKEESFNDILVRIDEMTSEKDSSLEYRFKVALTQRFPDHHFNYHDTFTDNAGNKYELDFLCRELGIAIEIDGFEWHNTRESFIRDRHKYTALQLEGYLVLVFSGTDLTIDGGIQRSLNQVGQAITRKTRYPNTH